MVAKKETTAKKTTKKAADKKTAVKKADKVAKVVVEKKVAKVAKKTLEDLGGNVVGEGVICIIHIVRNYGVQ